MWRFVNYTTNIFRLCKKIYLYKSIKTAKMMKNYEKRPRKFDTTWNSKQPQQRINTVVFSINKGFVALNLQSFHNFDFNRFTRWINYTKTRSEKVKWWNGFRMVSIKMFVDPTGSIAMLLYAIKKRLCWMSYILGMTTGLGAHERINNTTPLDRWRLNARGKPWWEFAWTIVGYDFNLLGWICAMDVATEDSFQPLCISREFWNVL